MTRIRSLAVTAARYESSSNSRGAPDMAKAVGIDLGTTNSVAAATRGRAARGHRQRGRSAPTGKRATTWPAPMALTPTMCGSISVAGISVNSSRVYSAVGAAPRTERDGRARRVPDARERPRGGARVDPRGGHAWRHATNIARRWTRLRGQYQGGVRDGQLIRLAEQGAGDRWRSAGGRVAARAVAGAPIVRG